MNKRIPLAEKSLKFIILETIGFVISLLCLIVCIYLYKRIEAVELVLCIIAFLIFALVSGYLIINSLIKPKFIIWYDERENGYSDDTFKLEYFHSFCYNNKKKVLDANTCFCFGCCKKFNPSEIIEYVDNSTAICPNCGNTSILADTIDENLDENIIETMHNYWF